MRRGRRRRNVKNGVVVNKEEEEEDGLIEVAVVGGEVIKEDREEGVTIKRREISVKIF